MPQFRPASDRSAHAREVAGRPGSSRRGAGRRMAAAAACGGLVLAGGWAWRHGAAGTPAPETGKAGLASAAPSRFDGMLDPRPALPLDALKLAGGPQAPATFRAAPTRTASATVTATGSIPKERVAAPLPPVAAVAPDAPRLAALVPLPVPRPADLTPSKATDAPQAARRPFSRRTRAAAVAAPQDNRSFLEKLFGVQPASGPSVAYAALGDGALPATAPAPRLSPLPTLGEGGTAVYDISARTVTLPNGERLEAHSGLGEKLDDPRFVHVRMRGATPPGTYELTEREQLFHGVRAIRLTPVGGASAVHGRAGLLAHTFMLGPNGDSNGCVSFRDYRRFLEAYLRGEVRRLVVVAGAGRDDGPFGRRFSAAPDRSAI